MSIKQYKILNIILNIVLVVIVSISISNYNYVPALLAFILSLLIMYFARKRVKGIIADEMDKDIAGKAARYTITATTLIMAAIVIVLASVNNREPYYMTLLLTLTAVTCGMLILNGIIFLIIKNRKNINK